MKLFSRLILSMSLMLLTILSSFSQNVNFQVELRLLGWGGRGDGALGSPEYVYYIWARDNANPTETGGFCIYSGDNFPNGQNTSNVTTQPGGSLFGAPVALRSVTNSSATQILFRTDAWEHDCAGGSINFGGGLVCSFESSCDCFPIIGCTQEDDDRAQCASVGAIDFRNDPPCQWNDYPPFSCGTFQYAVRVRWTYVSVDPGTISSPPFSICGSGDPPLINSFDLGSPNMLYQWQYQENCVGGWIDIFGATNSTYDPPTINNERCYRRLGVGCQFNGTSVNSASNIVQYVNSSPISNNVVTASQNFCQNPPVVPATFNGTSASGGVGVLSYQWQSSTDNGLTWVPIPGTASLTYTSPALFVNTMFRRRAFVAGGGCDNLSNIVSVQITPTLGNNNITGDQTICINVDPANLPGSMPVGGAGSSSYLYQWQQSVDAGATWTNIFGANTQSYDPSYLTNTTQYRRTVSSGGCFDVSNAITVVVLPLIDNNFISTSQSFCGPADPANLTGTTPTGGNGVYTYQWQESPDGLTWTDLISATAVDFDPGLSTATKYYRRQVTSGGCQSLSNIVSVSIIPLMTNNVIAGDQNYCGPSDAPFFASSTPNGGTGTYDYLWQESIDNGITWSYITGGNVQIFDPPLLSATTQYRRITNSGACTTVSNTATISITPVITNNTISGTQTFCGAADPVAFTDQLPGGGTGTYAYQWQESVDNGVTWGNIAGAVNHDYDAPLISLTTQYRRVITSGNCTSVSSPLVVSIIPVLGSNAISADQFYCGPADPTLLNGTAPNGGNGVYNITWQASTNSGASWTVVAGATLQNYDPPLSTQTNLYRRFISSGPCSSMSNNVLVDVTPVITNNTISSSQSICGPADPGVFTGTNPGGGTGAYTYQWQSSVDNGVTWGSIFGATSVDFDPSVISTTTQFRRIVNSGSCSDVSTPIIVTIFPVLTGNTIGSDQSFCGNADPALLTGTAPTGGNGSYNYQWQQSANGGASWSNVAGATSQNYDPPLSSQTRLYRRQIDSAPCSSLSNEVNIIITPVITSNTISGTATFCGATDPPIFTGSNPGGGNGTYSFEWQLSSDAGVTWSSVGGAISSDYDAPTISSTTQYRRIVSSESCEDVSPTITVTIVPLVANNAIASDQSYCGTADPTLLTGTAPTGGTGSYANQWQQSVNGGTVWTNIAGAVGQNFDPPVVTATVQYRRVVVSGVCNSLSNEALISITPVVTNNVISGAQVYCGLSDPSVITGTTATGGTGTVVYQWEQSTNNGISWLPIGGATALDYDPGFQTVTTLFRRLAISGNCTDISNTIEVTVVPVITNNFVNSDQNYCGATDATLLIGNSPSGGINTFQYSWESSTNGGTSWSTVAGVTSQNYDPPLTVTTTLYRRLVTSSVCADTSGFVTISITPAVLNNSISSSQHFCQSGDPAILTGTVPTGGAGTFSYQWEESLNGGVSWTTISGANAQDYDPGVLTTTTYYRRVSISGICNAVSNTVTISITPNPVISSVSATDVSCFGGDNGRITVTATGGSGLLRYSINGGGVYQISGNFTNLPAASYDVFVMDDSSCAVPFTFNPVVVAEPAVLDLTVNSVNPSCNSVNNGQIIATATGGSFPYRYSINGSALQQSNIFSGLGSGNYFVSLIDNNGCQDSAVLNLTNSYAIALVADSVSDISCYGLADGYISVTASNGTIPYEYTINGFSYQSSPVFSGLVQASYTITVRDQNGCRETVNATVSQPTLLAALIDSTRQVSCAGNNDGSIDVTTTGGTLPYTFAWNNSDNTEDLSNLGAGLYNLTVTDDNGCTVSVSTTIAQPNLLSVLLASYQDVSCFGRNDGRVDVSVTGGFLPYTYAWSNSAVTEDIVNVGGGTYTFTVTDQNGCSATFSQAIAEPSDITSGISGTNILCFGQGTGAVDLNVSGGTAPYRYIWNSGDTIEDLVNVRGGTYTCIITDVNGCQEVSSIVITEPAPLTQSAVVTPVACFGNLSGAIDLTVGGGFGTYTYAWSNSAAVQDLTGVAAGTYVVTVSDQNACTLTGSYLISQPTAALSLTSFVDSVSCSGQADGAIDLAVAGGTPTYAYSWSNSSSTEDLFNVPAGTYSVTVTDANSCTGTLSVNILQPAALSGTIAGVSPLCFGASTGSVDLTPVGGTQPYRYLWNTFDTLQDLNNLRAGTYTVVLTDANNCNAVVSSVLTQPTALVTGVSVTQVSCNGLSTGAVDLTVSGGSPGYTYSWSNSSAGQDLTSVPAGLYTVTVTDLNSCTAIQSATVNQPAALTLNATVGNVQCNFSGSGFINTSVTGGTGPYTYAWSNSAVSDDLLNINAGAYSLTVTDLNGCNTSATYNVSQPANNMNLLLTATPVSCGGAADGAIDLSVIGGALPLSYRWNSGQLTEDLNGISGGTYIVTVTDNNGCTASNGTQISEPTALIAYQTGITQVSCNGGNNGSVNVSVTGGSPAYVFNWSNSSNNEDLNNVVAGTYTLIVSDSRGCRDTVVAQITEPTALTATVAGSNPGCNGGTNGSATANVNGGTLPYRYLWNTFATTSSINNLSSGNYAVIVTDNNNCTVVASTTLTNSGTLTVSLAVTDIQCNGQNNGSITANPAGGSAPFTYSWSNLGTGQTINGLGGGFYSATVTDNNGCTATASTVLTEPDPMFLNMGTTDLRCFDQRNGQAIASAVGGTNPYTYSWNTLPVQTDIVADNLGPGTYSVTVTDARGCSLTGSAVVNSPPLLQAILVDSTSASCAGNNAGQIEIAAVGGVAPYEYSLDGSPYSSQTVYGGLDPGNHAIAVRDGNGCIAFGTGRLNEPANLTVYLPTDTIIAFGDNALLTPVIDAEAGVALISWTPSTDISCQFCPNPVVSPSTSTRYFVTVVDSNNCRATAFIDVNVSRNYDVLIPTAFSPNGDGIHDLYGIVPIGVTSVRMQIFNRWGEKVFEADGPNDRWDGTFRNKDCPIGVYIYSIDVTYRDGRKEVKGGNVTLLR